MKYFLLSIIIILSYGCCFAQKSDTANLPPFIDAGLDQVITLPTSSTILNGKGFDKDGVIVRYLWEIVTGKNGAKIMTPYRSKTVVQGLKYGTYIFKLTGIDNSSNKSLDFVKIIVYPQRKL